MEAHRERLAHQPGIRIGDDMAGVGVDADHAGDLHGHAGLLSGLPDRRIGRALTRVDVPAGQLPVAGVTAAHQQQPPGDVADRDESARGHAAGGGGHLADGHTRGGPPPAPARACRGPGPAGPRPGPARARHPRPVRAPATPDRRCPDQQDRRTYLRPAPSRLSWHAFPSHRRRDARGVWTSSPAGHGSRSTPQSSRRPDRCKPARSPPGPDAGHPRKVRAATGQVHGMGPECPAGAGHATRQRPLAGSDRRTWVGC